MDFRRKLFFARDPYDLLGTENLFLKAIAQNAEFHWTHCPEYRRICEKASFHPAMIRKKEDLCLLPVLPTIYLKAHPLRSLSSRFFQITATSSGTRGNPTWISFDGKSLFYGLPMVLRMTGYHQLRSLKPANYVVMGYQPHRTNHTAVAKTAFGATLLAPPLHREYILKYKDGGYQVDLEGVVERLLTYEKQGFPVRFMGFPAYTWFLLRELKNKGIRLQLQKDSRILLGGGWKQFYRERVEKEEFYALAEEVLGISHTRCAEFFGAVEHPILYCDCPNHHFHVPIYSRVIIRDVKTLQPVPYGTLGLVNLLTPMVGSSPVTSIMTDDLGVLYQGEACGCGISSPYLEIIGRVGAQGIKTCAAGAEELLQKRR